MSHLPHRWLGIILRIVRGFYPDARLSAWGPLVDSPAPRGVVPDARLELALLDPRDPDPDVLADLRGALDRSDLPVRVDLRPLGDLTIAEQEEMLERGEQFGG